LVPLVPLPGVLLREGGGGEGDQVAAGMRIMGVSGKG